MQNRVSDLLCPKTTTYALTPSVIVKLNNALCIVCIDMSLLFRSMYMYYDLRTVLYSFMDIIA